MFSFLRSLVSSSVRHTPKPLYLHNTLTGSKDVFTPLRAGRVHLYTCGPTVYDFQHIGNLRPYVFSDTLRRALEYNSLTVKLIINITDVGHLTGDNAGDADTGEDKLEKRARESHERVSTIVSRVTNAFFEDLDRLNIPREKVHFVKATDHIAEQIALIKTLEEKGYTYTTSDGVYFDTARFPGYGKLGNIDLKGLREGARIGENREKRNPTDFALWKLSPKDSERQQEWPSPWGVGFPGWHIECSAMGMRYLGKHFDIHTGGIDHIPVHHNNEIAQSEAATGKPLANVWLHNAFITIDGQKISKSIGNTVYLRQLIDRGFSALAYRLWLLGGHYRSPMNFTWEAIAAPHTALIRLHRFFIEELPTVSGEIDTRYQGRFHEAVNDDLNTPRAIGVLWDLVHDAAIEPSVKRATLLDFDSVLGLGLAQSGERLLNLIAGKEHRLSITEVPHDIQELAKKREEAREKKDFAESDRLRDELAARGWLVEDTANGQKLRRS